jgi:hypothetical protein
MLCYVAMECCSVCVVLCFVVLCCVVLCCVVLCCAVLCCAVLCCAVLLCCDVLWCDVMWCDVMWCGMVWYGMVWYGMVWYGMVWYGIVWYGNVWIWILWYEYGFSKLCNATYGGQRAVIKLRKQCQFLHLLAAVFYLEATKYTCNIRFNVLPPECQHFRSWSPSTINA